MIELENFEFIYRADEIAGKIGNPLPLSSYVKKKKKDDGTAAAAVDVAVTEPSAKTFASVVCEGGGPSTSTTSPDRYKSTLQSKSQCKPQYEPYTIPQRRSQSSSQEKPVGSQRSSGEVQLKIKDLKQTPYNTYHYYCSIRILSHYQIIIIPYLLV